MAGPITKTPVELIFDKGQANDEMLRAEQLSPRSVINGVFDGRGSLRQTRRAQVTSTIAPFSEESMQLDNRFFSCIPASFYTAIGVDGVRTNLSDAIVDYNARRDLIAKTINVSSVGYPYGGSLSKDDGEYDVYYSPADAFNIVVQHQLPDGPAGYVSSAVKVTLTKSSGATVETILEETGYSFYKPRILKYTTVEPTLLLYVWRTQDAAPTTAAIIQYTIHTTTGAVANKVVLATFTAITAGYAGRIFDASVTLSAGVYTLALAYIHDSAGHKLTLRIDTGSGNGGTVATTTQAITAIANHRNVFVRYDASYAIAYAVFTADRYLRRVSLTFAGAALAEFIIADTGVATHIVGRAAFDPTYSGYLNYDWYDSATGQTGLRNVQMDPTTNVYGNEADLPDKGILASNPFVDDTNAYTQSTVQWPILVNGHSLSSGLYGDTQSSLEVLSSGPGRSFTVKNTVAAKACCARLAFGEHIVMGLSSLHYTSRMSNNFINGVTSARISRSVETAGSTEVQVNYRFNLAITDFRTLRTVGSQRNSLPVGTDLLVAGACPAIIDGTIDNSATFGARPYLYSAASSGAVSTITAGVHRVRVVAVFVNRNGNILKSEPSNWLAFTAGAAHNTLTLGYNLYNNQAYNKNSSVEIYRTTVDDLNTYYLDNPTTPLSDASLVYGAQILTTGGALPGEPAPCCTFFAAHQNRIFACGGEYGDEVYFTHDLQPGFLPEWNQTFFFRRAPKDFGRLVSMVSIDDRLVLFGEHKIGIISGTGPDRTGSGDGYTQIQTIVGNFGCSIKAPLSPVATENGIWFEAARGMRFLGRNLSMEKDANGNWLGDSLDNLFDSYGWLYTPAFYQSTAALYVTTTASKGVKGPRKMMGVPSKSKELIYWVPGEFWTTLGVSGAPTSYQQTYPTQVIEALCFDTRTSQWTVRSFYDSENNGMAFTGTSGRHVVNGYSGAGIVTTTNSDQTLFLIPKEGKAMKTWYDDDTGGTPETMIVDTGWFGFAKVSGFQRVYDITVLLRDAEDLTYANPSDANTIGSSAGTCNLMIETSTDFNSNAWTTVFNATAPVKSTNTFVREVTCQLPVQKCESIRFRITVSGTTHPVRLTSARLTVGIKEGRNKGSLGRS